MVVVVSGVLFCFQKKWVAFEVVSERVRIWFWVEVRELGWVRMTGGLKTLNWAGLLVALPKSLVARSV